MNRCHTHSFYKRLYLHQRRILLAFSSFLFTFCSLFCQGTYQDVNREKILQAFTEQMHVDTHDATITCMSGGMTNNNYKVTIDKTSYFVRCSCEKNSLLGISIEQEWICSSIASSHNLSPRAVFYDRKEAVLATEYIDSKRVVDLHEPVTLRQFCCLMRKLHSLDEPFPARFCPFTSINTYMANALASDAYLPDDLFRIIIPAIDRIRRITPPCSKPVPCHLDLHSKNVLDDGQRLWLIDWEYAALSDPIFDLANVASVENYTDEEMKLLLSVYYDDRPLSQEEINHLYRMRILADIRWAVWSYLQERISPLDEPFRSYGDTFLKEALKRIETVPLE